MTNPKPAMKPWQLESLFLALEAKSICFKASGSWLWDLQTQVPLVNYCHCRYGPLGRTHSLTDRYAAQLIAQLWHRIRCSTDVRRICSVLNCEYSISHWTKMLLFSLSTHIEVLLRFWHSSGRNAYRHHRHWSWCIYIWLSSSIPRTYHALPTCVLAGQSFG